MFPKWLQVAIALSAFTGTWQSYIRSGRIKGIENILRTANDERTDDHQDDKYRDDDDESNEIVGIEPLTTYLNRLSNNGKQSRFNNDNRDRFDTDNPSRLNDNKRDRIYNENQDRLFDENLYQLFNDNREGFTNDNQNRYYNDNRNRLKSKRLDRINDNRDRSFHDNLDQLFNDNQDLFTDDNRDRYDNDNQNRLNSNKRNKIDDNRDRLFHDRLDQSLNDNQNLFSNDNQDRYDNDNQNRFNNYKRLDQLFNDNQDGLKNNKDSINDNRDRLFDDLQRLFNDNHDSFNNDNQNRFSDNSPEKINNDNKDRLFNENENKFSNDYQDRFDYDALETFLREKSEDMCKKTGRCGCGRGVGRCGESEVEQKTVNDVRIILDALEDKLNKESRLNKLANRDTIEEDSSNARNNVINLNDLIRDINNAAEKIRIKTKVDRALDDNHVDVVLINDLADIDEVLRQSGLLKSNGLDDVTNDDFIDLTRYGAKPRDSVKAVVLDLGKFYNESENRNNQFGTERSSSSFQNAPHDFFGLFGKLKDKVNRDLVKYVVSKNAEKPNFDVMNFNHKEKIRILKDEMRKNEERTTKNQEQTDLKDILFGHGGKLKIVPSDDIGNQVKIPNRMYRIVKGENNIFARSPRKKRVLPLTNKQKTKLVGKSKNLAPPIGRYWRRNFIQKSQKYGLPFQLSLQGLAQYHN